MTLTILPHPPTGEYKATPREMAREEILQAIYLLATQSIEDVQTRLQRTGKAGYEFEKYLTDGKAAAKIKQQRRIYNKFAVQWGCDEGFDLNEGIRR